MQRKTLPKRVFPENRNLVPSSKHPVRTLLFIRAWAQRKMTLDFYDFMFDMNEAATVKLNAAMRRVAEEWLLKNLVPVGSPSLTVAFGNNYQVPARLEPLN
uniref:Uncharacterized protein n=1 Tax=Trichuris muris TaxID=70415 RepID=A0A5S6R5J2_TRIMR